MKRIGNLYKLVIAPENLRCAFAKARKGKTDRPDVIEFQADLDANITRLYNELWSKTYQTGEYRSFKITEPKERIISAAPL